MKKIIIYILLLVSQFSLAQINCEEKEIQTDPNNPFNPNTSQNQPTYGEPWLNDGDFNWLTPGLMDYYRSDWQQVLNPFDDSGNPNIDYISVPLEIRDNKPEDGWELITYRYGYDYLNSPVSIPQNVPNSSLLGVSHPSYILYNKYTGLLRVLIYLNRDFLNHDYQTASILLRHEEESFGQKQNALLTFSEPIAWALDEFKKKYAFEAANIVGVDDGYWLIGDFPMAYDPCVCNFPTDLLVVSKLIDVANINLEGNIATENIVEVTADKSKENITFNSFYREFFGRSSGAIKNGLKKYKEVDGLVTQFEKLANKEKSAKKKEESSFSLIKFIQNLFKSSSDLENSNQSSGGNGTNFLKSLPKIGAMVGFLDFFLTGGKSGSNTNKQSVTPISFEANIKMTGTLQTTGIGPSIKFATPGSKHNTSNLTRETPMYNEALGIFNLVETPIIDVVTYNNIPSCPIKQYKVRNDLKYALNPAADLEVMDLKATLVISYEPSLFKGDFPTPKKNFIVERCLQPGTDDCPFPRPVNERKSNITHGMSFAVLEQMGYGIETIPETFPDEKTTARLNIGYSPIGCFQDASFLLSVGIEERYEEPKIYCKIAATFKRQDDPNAQPIDLVVTYNVKLEPTSPSSQNTWTFGPGGLIFSSVLNPDGKAYPTPLLVPLTLNFNGSFNAGFPDLDDPIIGDEVGPGLVEARESIIIGDGTTILPGTHIVAPSIDINPSVDIPDDVTIEISEPSFIESCGAVSPSNFRVTDFTSVCNNNDKYNPVIPAFLSNTDTRSNSIENNSIADSDLNVEVYPNPFFRNLNVEYNLIKEDKVTLTLQNALGQTIKEKHFTQQAGEQLEMIEGLDLPNGMYYLTIRTTDSIKTIKISKQGK